MKHKKFIVPIYGTVVTLYRTEKKETFEALKKKLSEKYYLSTSETAGGFCFSKVIKGYHHVVIAVDTGFHKKTALLGVILHEIIHAVNFIFVQKGVVLDRYNDETQAYFTEWMFMKVYKFFK